MKYIPYWQECFGRVRLTPYKLFTVVFILILIVGLFVFSLILYGSISTENEKKWIETSNPASEAEKSFRGNNVIFLQIWFERTPAGKNDPLGIWITPGELEIGAENIRRFPLKQLSVSSRWDESLKTYNLKAMDFALKYNARMAELIAGKNGKKNK